MTSRAHEATMTFEKHSRDFYDFNLAIGMMLLALVATLLVALPAKAQDTSNQGSSAQSTTAPSTTAPSTNDKAERKQKMEKLSKELNLTDDQKSQIKALKADTKKQVKAIKSDSSLSDQQKKEKIKELRQSQRQKMDS